MTKKGHHKFWAEKSNFFPKKGSFGNFGSKRLRKTQGQVSAHALAGDRSHTYFFSKRPLYRVYCLRQSMNLVPLFEGQPCLSHETQTNHRSLSNRNRNRNL